MTERRPRCAPSSAGLAIAGVIGLVVVGFTAVRHTAVAMAPACKPHKQSCSPAPTPSSTASTPAPSPTSSTPAPSPSTTASSTPAPSPTSTSSAPAGQLCTSPYFTTSAPNGGVSDGGFYVHNNLWNASNYPGTTGTTAVCSYHSWNHYATASNTSGDGAVKTYPNVHKDYSPARALSAFPRLTTTEAMTSPGIGIYDVAYDLWLNGIASSTSTEVMIWTENHDQRPAGSIVATGLTFAGYSWDLWSANNNHYLAFTARAATAGAHPGWPANDIRSPATLDVQAMLAYLTSTGRLPTTSVLNQLCFGVEIVDTGGVQRTWNLTNFSLADA